MSSLDSTPTITKLSFETKSDDSEPVKPTVEKKIIFIRHAESEWNPSGTTERNTGLTENGRKSCKSLDFNVDIVICSPLKRARETLDNSNIIYKDVIFNDSCREILGKNPAHYYNGEPYHEETQDEINERVNGFKDELREISEYYDTICVISHHNFLKELTGYHFQNCHYLNFSVEDL